MNNNKTNPNTQVKSKNFAERLAAFQDEYTAIANDSALTVAERLARCRRLREESPDLAAYLSERPALQPPANDNEPPIGERLPVWPEPVRAVPNGFLRSALFGAIAKGRRRYMDAERIASLEGLTIFYTGQRLDQGDLDVWESVLHLARLQGLGEECRVTAYALLKMLGKTDTGKNRAVLEARLTRLNANALKITQGRYSYFGSLIQEAFKDEKTQEWVIVINPNIRPLFESDQFTQLDWEIRKALDGKPLAQWLHGFYASHKKPYPMKIETLLQLSGSENITARSNRQKVRKSLHAVAAAASEQGQPFAYEITDGLVRVEK